MDTIFSRRLFLSRLVLPVSASTGYPLFVEPRWLRTTEHEVSVFRGEPGNPVRLAHLSDLHASPVVPNALIEAAVDRVVALRPDVICVTGDFVTGRGGYSPEWFRGVLARLSAAAPTFGVLGNHDGGAWAAQRGGNTTTNPVTQLATEAGIRIMRNDAVKLRLAGRELQLAGAADWWAEELDPVRTARQSDSHMPTVLLSHNPDTKNMLDFFDWRLMLSGHTHGGQVQVPLVGSPWAPVMDKNYLEGLKPWRDRWIHVSRGVGSAGGVRFNCRPEVSLLRLV